MRPVSKGQYCGGAGLWYKKTAIGYLTMAVILKLTGELILIIKMWAFINFTVILQSLSVPVLGIAILLAYLTCYRPGK